MWPRYHGSKSSTIFLDRDGHLHVENFPISAIFLDRDGHLYVERWRKIMGCRFVSGKSCLSFFSLFSCHIWKTMATWRNDFSSYKSHLLMKVLLISSTWMVVVSGFRPTADSWCVNINLGILPFIRCREKAPGPFIGGPLVDQAVNAVFAALVWHSQELRDQIVLLCKLIVFYLALFSSLLPRCHKSECSM